MSIPGDIHKMKTDLEKLDKRQEAQEKVLTELLEEVKLIRLNSDKITAHFAPEVTGTEINHGQPVPNT